MSKDYEADEKALDAEKERVLAVLAVVRPEARIAQLELQLAAKDREIEELTAALRTSVASAKELGARYIRLRSGVLRFLDRIDAAETEMAVVLGASGE